MSINEGSIDRLVRVISGTVLLALVFVGPQTRWGLLGLVPLLTGVVGFCPLYRVVGISTCPISTRNAVDSHTGHGEHE